MYDRHAISLLNVLSIIEPFYTWLYNSSFIVICSRLVSDSSIDSNLQLPDWMSSIVYESSILKLPCFVLCRLDIVPTVFNLVHISSIKALKYVPFETVVLKMISSSLYDNNSILVIFISRLGSSTCLPSLAYSYSFFPFTFTAEYIGVV